MTNPDPSLAPYPAVERPYSPRDLTRRELQKLDVHTFQSPKERRRVRVVGPALVLALRLEFDPDVVAYVERPRRLVCGPHTYEFSFWYRERSGREHLLLLVPTSESAPLAGGRRRHRQAEQLLDAAEAAHLPLRFEHESDLIAQSNETASWLRMLPSVQLAQRLENRLPLRTRIVQIVGQFERCRMSQLEAALDGYSPADVRCITCDLAHAGLLAFDAKASLHQHTLFWVRRP